MEYGSDDENYFDGRGWMARYLTHFNTGNIFSGVAVGSGLTRTLQGHPDAISLSSADGFTLRGNSGQTDDLRRALRQIYNDVDDPLATVGQTTLDAVDLVDLADPDNYTPNNGVDYPNDSEGRAFESLAQIIRLELGLQCATIDIGGWDTHQSQANSWDRLSGTYSNNIRDLSEAIHAFWSDMTDYHDRITIVVMSEFGRRLKENNNVGTDHGHGGVMIVVSGNLQSSGIYGQWPGLEYENLFQGNDLNVTTDWRSVLGEILVGRCGMTPEQMSDIFPYYTFTNPPGFFGVQGLNMSPSITDYLLGNRAYTQELDSNQDLNVDITDIIHAVNGG